MAMTNSERSARYRAKDVDAYRKKKREMMRMPDHREVRRLYQQKWREANREKHNAQALASHHRNKYKHVGKVRGRHLKREYGITEADYVAMLAAQDGRCAVCGTNKPTTTRNGAGRFHVDHCHIRNVVRGILCNKCNTNLGVLEVWYAAHRAKIDAYLAK